MDSVTHRLHLMRALQYSSIVLLHAIADGTTQPTRHFLPVLPHATADGTIQPARHFSIMLLRATLWRWHLRNQPIIMLFCCRFQDLSISILLPLSGFVYIHFAAACRMYLYIYVYVCFLQ